MRSYIVFAVLLLCLGINAKTCLDQVKELEAKPPLLGAFKPVCQPNGLFAETQCHASYCYCVATTTGAEILGTRVRFTRPKSCKSTPCMMQRHEGLLKSQKGMVGHFKPECEENGSFKEIQCHGSTGFCYCVATDTGVKIVGTDVRGTPDCANRVKKCLEEVKALEAKPPMLGAFKPVCQSNGLYQDTQCFEGQCYCVVQETGEQILGTIIKVNKPKSCKATPCFMQRHGGLLKSQKGMVGQFTPQCEEDGSFKTVQCHGSTGYCFCVTDTGLRIPGTEVRGKPVCTGLKTTKCLDAVKALESKPRLRGAFKPVCQANGLYQETQCHEGYCYCVYPETGDEVLGTRVRFSKPKSCKITPCFTKRHHALKDSSTGMVGQFTPQCEEDGSFSSTQCWASTGYCFCVIPESGEKLLGTEVRFRKPKNCDLTECVNQRHMALKSHLLGVFKPTCDENGVYTAMQCREGICYCVFSETGEEVLGTKLARGQKPLTCKVSKCMQERHNYLSATRPLLGAFKPQCTDDGKYNPIQCREGHCYCVFPESGEEVFGTMTRSKPKSCKLTPCVLSRHKGWKLSQIGLLGVPISRCDEYGSYDKVQCRKGMCWCVDPATGQAVKGQSPQWTIPNCN